jgi:hypothetical protein
VSGWASSTPVKVSDFGRASALRFGDPRVPALLGVLVQLSLQVEGFRNRQLRPLLAQMLGLAQSEIKPGQMSYHLRRLRLHGLIARVEGTHRYKLTKLGLRIALFYQRTYARVLRPGLSAILAPAHKHPSQPHELLRKLQTTIDDYLNLYAA